LHQFAVVAPDLKVFHLHLSYCTGLVELPSDLRIRGILELTGCTGLTRLPPNLKEDRGARESDDRFMDLSGCTRLAELPDDLFAESLLLCDCTSLKALPVGFQVGETLDLSGCTGLTKLPEKMAVGFGLYLERCINLAALPEDLEVGHEIDIADTGIRELPTSLSHVQLLWHGVEIDRRTAFEPETLTVQEILQETYNERQAIMIQRFGVARFKEEIHRQGIDFTWRPPLDWLE